jgi:CsoR family transcriptional regulator, copper-sensing transcriptional repressor
MAENLHVHTEDLSRERADALKRDVLNRLRSIAGHVNGIARMVEEDKYCIDVIHQVEAVQAALDRVSLLVLDDHMHHCVTNAIRSGDPAEGERVLGELREVFAALSNR